MLELFLSSQRLFREHVKNIIERNRTGMESGKVAFFCFDVAILSENLYERGKKKMLKRRRSRACSFAALGMLILLGLSSCASPFGLNSSESHLEIDWVDFVQFHGIQYRGQSFSPSQSKQLQEKNLGPVFSTVRFKVAGNVTELGYHIKDGDAAFLDAGTNVYTVKGYQPWFRLAAHSRGVIVLYEVSQNPKAKRGADLLDIDGKVRSISINSEQDGVTELAAIKDPQQVAMLVTLIDNAPIRTPSSNLTAAYFLALHFTDGTIFTRQYWAAPAPFFGDLMMQKKFQNAIEHAVHPK